MSARRLNNDEIRELLVGKRIRFDSSAHDVTRGEGFEAGGAWERYGGRDSEFGSYTVKDQLICVDDGSGERCRRVFLSPEGYLIDPQGGPLPSGQLVKIISITPF